MSAWLGRTATHDVKLLIRAGIVVSCLFMFGRMAISDWQAHQSAIAGAEVNARNISLLIDENVSSTFQSVELAMGLVRKPNLALYSQEEIRELEATLSRAAEKIPVVQSVEVIDGASSVRLWRFERVAGAGVPAKGDAPQLRSQPGSDFMLSVPFRAEDGRWLMRFGRRDPESLGQTMVAVTLDLDEINRTISSVAVGENGAAVVLSYDGIVLARAPKANSIGSDTSRGYLFGERLRDGRQSGVYQSRSALDQVERIVSFRTIPQYGLVVLAGYSKDEVLKAWRSGALSDAVAVAAISAVLVLLGQLLLRAVRRNELFRDELQRNAEHLQATLENIDQGLLMIDADGIVAVHNRRFNELLDMDPEFTRGKPHYIELRKRLVENQEYAKADPVFQQWVANGSLVPVDACYQRTRPNGTVLEVRSVALPGGGAVRTYSDVTAREQAEKALEESEARYRLLSDNANDLIVFACADRKRRYVSPRVTPMLGYTVEEALDLTVRDFTHPDDLERVRARLRQLDGADPTSQLVFRMRRADGTYIWVESSLKYVFTEDGPGAVCVTRDISERRRVEADLAEKTTVLQVTLDTIDQGLMMIDVDHCVRICNRRAMELLELPADLVARKPGLQELVKHQLEKNDFARSDTGFVEWVQRGGLMPDRQCYERERPNGQVLEVTTIPIERGGWVRTFTDITERKVVERRITHASRHDVLTNLPNRLVFREHLERAIAEIGPSSARLAVLYLDLDRFKAVNDSFGHHIGDVLLKEVTARLRTALRREDVLARLGGDEFALVHADASRAETEAMAARLIELLEMPFDLEGRPVKVGASIGIAHAPDHGLDADKLLKAADRALYRAKETGRNTFRTFEPGMDREIVDRQALEYDLREALSLGQLSLAYQPVMKVADARVVSCEALLRWQHPARGNVAPSTFIPLAEETGLIVEIGAWVLREACLAATRWGPRIGVAVNVSAIQFDHDLVGAVKSALDFSGLAPSRLAIEITESVLIREGDGVLAVLQRIRALGVRIALDDFGTGFSSLSYLRRFPLDTIKIDKSFVGEIDEPTTAAIIETIISLGERLAVEITAEGVETLRELELICAKGCTHVQGYLISRPLPNVEFRGFLDHAERLSAAA